MSTANPATLAGALDRMWSRFLPEMLQRVAILDAAAAAHAASRLTPSQAQAAVAAAHKLAGVLGTFGLSQGTELARDLEKLYSAVRGPARTKSALLIASTMELRTIIESRK